MKKILLGTAAAGIMALSIGLPTVAKAGVVPTPEPSQQLVTPYPNHHPQPIRLRPEQFEIAIDQVGGRLFDTVDARGPVRLTDGDDTVLSQFRDFLSDRGPNAVNLDHNRLAPPILVNPNTCSAVFVQQSPWQFRGGRGIYRNEIGFGNLVLTGLVSARQLNFHRWNWNPSWNYNQNMNWNYVHPANRGVCPLRSLSPAQILRLVILHRQGIPVPVQFDQFSFNIQGTGVASQPRQVRYPGPCQYQTDGPTLNAYHGDPSPQPRDTCYPSVPAPERLAA